MLYLFDIDGTLITSFLDRAQPRDYDEVLPMDGRRPVLRRLIEEPDARFALVTNQAGVAMGYQTVAQVRAKIGRVLAEFAFFAPRPVSVHVCFHHPNPRPGFEFWRTPGGDDRRKPGPGMLREALASHEIAPGNALYVGDMETDRLAAVAAGVRYFDEGEFFEMPRVP